MYDQNIASTERSYMPSDIKTGHYQKERLPTRTLTSRSIISRITKTAIASCSIVTVMLTAAVVRNALVYFC